jgi:two-component system, chemotaxis family, protein-glutamate methylesterase/glutaminase
VISRVITHRNTFCVEAFDFVPPSSYIVTIGGSAGAFRAVEIILQSLPDDLPAAVCIALHLQPSDASWLPQRLGPYTSLPIVAPIDEALEAGRVYTAIPDRHLMVKGDRVISTRGPRENLWRPAIDVLFRSAAVSHSTRVIGVLLSGELDDGTSGLQAISACGGTTIVQEPGDAQYATMPEVALANLKVDHRLPVADIGAHLLALMRQMPEVPGDIPEEIRREVAMAEGESDLLTTDINPDAPSGLTCPECAGPLWQRHGIEAGFRCLVGHAYQLNTLLHAHDQDLDRTLWAAVRAFEQRANIAQAMSDQAKARGFDRRAEIHSLRAVEARQHAMRLRHLQALHHTTIVNPVEDTRQTESG